jgi:predicted nucleotidyltransferase
MRYLRVRMSRCGPRGPSSARGGVVDADDPLSQALRSVAAALGNLAAPSMIIGGIAVIAAGVPRQTIDVDATVLGRGATVDEVVAAFAQQGISPRISNALEFARERQVLLLKHDATGVTAEVSFAWLPFEEEALARATAIDLSGQMVRVAIPEDLIVYKAAAWRDRDRSDIERLLSLHFDAIDLQRVRALIVEIAAALDDPARVDAFDQIVARVRQV